MAQNSRIFSPQYLGVSLYATIYVIKSTDSEFISEFDNHRIKREYSSTASLLDSETQNGIIIGFFNG